MTLIFVCWSGRSSQRHTVKCACNARRRERVSMNLNVSMSVLHEVLFLSMYVPSSKSHVLCSRFCVRSEINTL